MTTIINKITFKNKTIQSEKISQFGNNTWAILPDNLKIEIESKYYQDGTYFDDFGVEHPNMVDIGCVKSLVVNSDNEVTQIIWHDRDEKIAEYLAKKRKDYFRGKQNKVIVNVKGVLPSEFEWILTYAEIQKSVIVEKINIDYTDIVLYFDDEHTKLLNACQNNPDLFQIEYLNN